MIIALLPEAQLKQNIFNGLSPCDLERVSKELALDEPSQTAISGPVTWKPLLESVGASFASIHEAADVLNFINHVLRAAGLKGNALHCVRTFHIMTLLSKFLVAQPEPQTLDEVAVKFLGFLQKLDDATWKLTVGISMPMCYVPLMREVFGQARTVLKKGVTRDAVHDILSAGHSPSVGWQEARLRLEYSIF